MTIPTPAPAAAKTAQRAPRPTRRPRHRESSADGDEAAIRTSVHRKAVRQRESRTPQRNAMHSAVYMQYCEPVEILRDEFMLDPRVAYLNHGAFGATPRRIHETRLRFLREIELNPTRTIITELKETVDAARGALATALSVPAETLAFTSNATTGLNLVARSLMSRLHPGDEVLLTDVEYGSQVMLWEFVCERRQANLRFAPVCGLDPAAVADAIGGCVTERTRVVEVSHISSMTALRLP